MSIDFTNMTMHERDFEVRRATRLSRMTVPVLVIAVLVIAGVAIFVYGH